MGVRRSVGQKTGAVYWAMTPDVVERALGKREEPWRRSTSKDL